MVYLRNETRHYSAHSMLMIIYYNAAMFSSNAVKHSICKSVICKLHDASIFIANFIAGLFRETRIAIVFGIALLNASHLPYCSW